MLASQHFLGLENQSICDEWLDCQSDAEGHENVPLHVVALVGVEEVVHLGTCVRLRSTHMEVEHVREV